MGDCSTIFATDGASFNAISLIGIVISESVGVAIVAMAAVFAIIAIIFVVFLL